MRIVHRVVDRLFPFDPSMPDAHARRTELVRETGVMILYLSVVLLATLAALPNDFGASDHGSVVLIVWGTTVGLALAHWFAFRLATAALGDGTPSRHDVSLGVAQVLGAAFVALVATVAIVIAPPGAEIAAAVFVPASFIGVAGYAVARGAGRSAPHSLVVACVVLVLGLVVALIKVWLGGH